MPNKILTTQEMVDAAAVVLESQLCLTGALSHQVEDKFIAGSGDTVDVRVINSLAPARDLNEDGTVQVDELNETSVPVTLEKHFYKAIDLTTKNRTLDIADFSLQVVQPVVDSLIRSIEFYAAQRLVANAGGQTGGAFGVPKTLADCARANRWFTKHQITRMGRYAFVGDETEEALLQLDAFTSAAYGQDGPQALREATIGRRLGMDFVVNPYATQVAAIPGTLEIDTAAAKGSVAVSVTGITAGTAIPAGAALTIGGTTYFVAEAVASAVAAKQTLVLSVPLKAAVTTSTTITANIYTQSIIAQKSCAAVAIVAPTAATGAKSAVANYKGVAIRATETFNRSTLKDELTLDVLCGIRVLNPDACALFTAV